MKTKCILALMMILTMGNTACSSDSGNNTIPAETTIEQEIEHENNVKTEIKTTETQTDHAEAPKNEITGDSETEPTADEEIITPDPFIGIVEEYTGDTITISNLDDGMLLYFSTKNAQIIEGDSPIAVGDKVEITYQGLMGDETHPTEAIKIVADKNPYLFFIYCKITPENSLLRSRDTGISLPSSISAAPFL